MVETMPWQEERRLQTKNSESDQAMIGRNEKWILMNLFMTSWISNCEFEIFGEMKSNSDLNFRYRWVWQAEMEAINRDWRTAQSRILSRNVEKIYSRFGRQWKNLKWLKQLKRQQLLEVFFKEYEFSILMNTWDSSEKTYSKENKQQTDVLKPIHF